MAWLGYRAFQCPLLWQVLWQVLWLVPSFLGSFAARFRLAVSFGDYHIHDYLQWNRSRADVLAERDRKSKAGRKGAEKRWH